jgi:hypothetical protein
MEFQGASFQNLGSWLLRLARLDLTVFDDIKDDVSATVPAIAVVVAATVLAGLGSWLWWFNEIDYKNGEAFLKSLVLGGIFQVGLWYLWVYVSAMILSRGFRVSIDINQMVRTMGLAFAPMAFCILIVISILAVPIGIIAVGLTLVLTNIAIAATTNADGRQVMIANFMGFLVFAIILGILSNISEVGGGSVTVEGVRVSVGGISMGGGLAPGIFFFNLSP